MKRGAAEKKRKRNRYNKEKRKEDKSRTEKRSCSVISAMMDKNDGTNHSTII